MVAPVPVAVGDVADDGNVVEAIAVVVVGSVGTGVGDSGGPTLSCPL